MQENQLHPRHWQALGRTTQLQAGTHPSLFLCFPMASSYPITKHNALGSTWSSSTVPIPSTQHPPTAQGWGDSQEQESPLAGKTGQTLLPSNKTKESQTQTCFVYKLKTESNGASTWGF